MEKKIPHDLSSRIDNQRKTNNNRLPHHFFQTIPAKTKLVCPWLTYNKLMNYNCAQAKKNKPATVTTSVTNRGVLVRYIHQMCVAFDHTLPTNIF